MNKACWDNDSSDSDSDHCAPCRRRLPIRSGGAQYSWGIASSYITALARDGVRPVSLPRPSAESMAWATFVLARPIKCGCAGGSNCSSIDSPMVV
eukprot:m51a1_g12281 hypothetical protein (95) ;mRNA; r:242252-242603